MASRLYSTSIRAQVCTELSETHVGGFHHAIGERKPVPVSDHLVVDVVRHPQFQGAEEGSSPSITAAAWHSSSLNSWLLPCSEPHASVAA